MFFFAPSVTSNDLQPLLTAVLAVASRVCEQVCEALFFSSFALRAVRFFLRRRTAYFDKPINSRKLYAPPRKK